MKHCSFFCKGWWPFLLFPLLLLLPLLYFQWHDIEENVAANTSQQLQSKGFEWAQPITHMRGRDVLISGMAPNQAALDQARDVALAAEGARVVSFVNNNIAPAEPSPPQLEAIVTGDSIVLRGVVSNQATINRLVSQAESAFGTGKVVNKLVVGENIAMLERTSGLFTALANDAGNGIVTASIHGASVTLSGQVLNEDVKSLIGTSLANVFSGPVENQLTIMPPAPVENNVCEGRVKELLASGQINFQTGDATIAQDSFALLDQISATAQQCPDAEFEISGHTDSTGNAKLNMTLSQQRAQSVLNYLTGQGLPEAQFTAVGYGPDQPIASNDTAQGRAKNRRIVFKIKN